MNIAIVTGTRSGLGRAIETALEASGWSVASMSRPRFDLSNLDTERADDFFGNIAKAGFDRAVLIHNAAELKISPAKEIHHDAKRILGVNLVAAVELTGLFLKHIHAGEIALISSAAARVGITHWSLYSAAKAGMEGFLRSLKAEGVPTHLIVPDIIDTDMQRIIRETPWPDAERFRDYQSRGRLRPPSEIAEKVLAALSPRLPADRALPAIQEA